MTGKVGEGAAYAMAKGTLVWGVVLRRESPERTTSIGQASVRSIWNSKHF